MEKKIIHLCLLLPTIHSGDFPLTETEIYGEYLPSLGHEVDWITPCHEKSDAYPNKFKKVNVYPVYYPHFHSFFLFRIYGFIIYYYSKYKLFNELFKRKDYDIIQVRDNAFDSLLALYLKQRYDVFFLFQYTFPTGSYQLKGYKNTFKKLYGVLDKFCINFILKKADFIFPISNLMKDDLVLSGINSDKIMPIPMGVNIDTFRQQSTDKIREEFKLFDSKVFLYVGTLSYLRKLDVMINAFSIVKKRYENVKLLIVGEGDDKLKLEKLVFSLKLEKDVIFTGSNKLL